MNSSTYDVSIIGGGIIGLATALRLIEAYPKHRIAVVEKEALVGSHQTGHNSGVIHSGIYYKPGSHKAKLCVSGVESLVWFCEENGIEFKRCGKVIVATDESELGRLEELRRRGTENGVQGLELIGQERLKEIEPHARGLKALYVPGTGIVDFKAVAEGYAQKVGEGGGEILTEREVTGIVKSNGSITVQTSQGAIDSKFLINCAGLYADKVAHMMGAGSGVRIIPFRGEYYVLKPQSRNLVRSLIYPVPDPRFPFLGVHFTHNIHDEVEAGPNAVLALAREGYKKSTVDLADMMDVASYTGFWKMAVKYWEVGFMEFRRSVSKGKFVHDLRKLVPDIGEEDLMPGGSGVRAQAVDSSGRLLDDFSVTQSEGAIHVLNAPSPGATSSLSIGSYIAELAGQAFDLTPAKG